MKLLYRGGDRSLSYQFNIVHCALAHDQWSNGDPVPPGSKRSVAVHPMPIICPTEQVHVTPSRLQARRIRADHHGRQAPAVAGRKLVGFLPQLRRWNAEHGLLFLRAASAAPRAKRHFPPRSTSRPGRLALATASEAADPGRGDMSSGTQPSAERAGPHVGRHRRQRPRRRDGSGRAAPRRPAPGDAASRRCPARRRSRRRAAASPAPRNGRGSDACGRCAASARASSAPPPGPARASR